jgi:hypothetical protein
LHGLANDILHGVARGFGFRFGAELLRAVGFGVALVLVGCVVAVLAFGWLRKRNRQRRF